QSVDLALVSRKETAMSRAQSFRPNAQPKGIPRPSRAAAVATSAALVAVAGADVLSTFDSDAEGWTSVTMCWRAGLPQASLTAALHVLEVCWPRHNIAVRRLPSRFHAGAPCRGCQRWR